MKSFKYIICVLGIFNFTAIAKSEGNSSSFAAKGLYGFGSRHSTYDYKGYPTTFGLELSYRTSEQSSLEYSIQGISGLLSAKDYTRGIYVYYKTTFVTFNLNYILNPNFSFGLAVGTHNSNVSEGFDALAAEQISAVKSQWNLTYGVRILFTIPIDEQLSISNETSVLTTLSPDGPCYLNLVGLKYRF